MSENITNRIELKKTRKKERWHVLGMNDDLQDRVHGFSSEA